MSNIFPGPGAHYNLQKHFTSLEGPSIVSKEKYLPMVGNLRIFLSLPLFSQSWTHKKSLPLVPKI